VLAAIAASGCAKSRQSASTASYEPCDVVTGIATSYGRGTALRYADANFKSQIPDARGELLSIGLRRVRAGPKRVSCSPYALFGAGTSWTTCAVQARVCGR
jgi:hypothetical protein